MVAPINRINKIDLPEGVVTVAVHIRRGSGNDGALLAEKNKSAGGKNYLDVYWPDKAPSVNFYIDQIKRLSSLVNDQKMYVYVFTDDKKPGDLVSRMDSELNMPNVTFDYRKEQVGVLDDFFAMTYFDCLIRSNSNFSKCVEPLGDYKVVIYLKHAYWGGKEVIVDDVVVKINQQWVDEMLARQAREH
jgi:hypothetical protein